MWDDGLISLIYFFPMDESNADVNRFNIQLNSIQKSITKHCKSALTWREWNVIKERFYSCKTIEEVGNNQNVTRHRIWQIEGRALRKLRRFHCAQFLKSEYLDEDGNVEDFGRPLPNWIWTTGMHVYEKLWKADNISFDAANPLTPLPWNDSVQNLEVFEESLRNTKTTAILKQIGYDVRQPEEERHAIIQYAISVCGISRVYKCLKSMVAMGTKQLTSTYRKDWIYVIRNRENLAGLSNLPEDLSAININCYKAVNIDRLNDNNKNSNTEAIKEQDFDIFRSLRPESFLMQLGYNTFVPPEERYDILSYAIRMYGQDMIIRLLRFFITIHKGDKKMQRACQIWQEDLERCLEQ